MMVSKFIEPRQEDPIRMTEPWHDECHRLRAEGLSQPEIAARLLRSPYAVRLALNESPEQELNWKRARERARQRSKPRDRTPKKKGNRFQSYWAARAAAPQTITADIQRKAIFAFSRHEIDVAELMKRITPRDKWSRGGLLREE